MSADPITRLNAALDGRYRIEREIGEGGMATVYLARDLKHNRNVALKVLKPELAAVVGAERFLAEIETTANLQHPHILPLFDSGEADSFLFYVMPYVEGETLRDRIDRERQLPVDEALGIATSVASALQHAHDRGVIHRDIKPGNILLQDGQPLVADFGIALAVGAAGGTRLTETGLSVGTPYYMSPEQATGDQAVGPSSDTFSLACVLYEMLVGEPPYPGNTAQAVLGKIIQGAPVSATAVRKSIPLHVDAAIRKALEKIPADRFTGAQDFAKALADKSFRHGETAGAVVGGDRRMRWVAIAGWGTAAVAFLALGFGGGSGAEGPPTRAERFAAPFLPGQEATFLGPAGFDLSPDGSMLVYRYDVPDDDQPPFLAVRRWDELSATVVRETVNGMEPAVSTDGLELAFWQGDEIKVLALAGGPLRTLGRGDYPEWGPDGSVYFTVDSGTVRVPAAGGALEPLSRIEEGEVEHQIYEILPDGEAALMMVFEGDGSIHAEVLDLESGERRHLVEGLGPRYVPSGHLLYSTSDGTLMAARFDVRRREIVGTPVAILDDVGFYSVSDDGKLFYSVGAGNVGANDQLIQLVRVSRDGVVEPLDPDWTLVRGGADTGWRVSADGTMLAVRERTADGNDIWIKRLPDGPRSRLTFGPDEERKPIWRPGTNEVTFLSDRGGNLDVWSKPADGVRDEELIFDFERDVAHIEWSPDGEWLVVRTAGPPGVEGGRDVYAIRPGVDSVATPLLANQGYDEIYPMISPDGRYVAYQSTETDRHEIYVRPFPDVTAGRWQVSIDGGRQPTWSPSGQELFFQGPTEEMMVVDVDTREGFTSGTPRRLFDEIDEGVLGDIYGDFYTVTPDGESFIMARFVNPTSDGDGEDPGPATILVNNFFTELERLLPTP